MSSHLIRLPRLLRPLTHHHHPAAITTITNIRHSSTNPFQSTPAPPRLPADQQAEFERLQRVANTQDGFNPTSTPDFSSTATPTADSQATAKVEEGEEFTSIPLRKGAPPEFEGDVNPKTGEVGGPKNEPLRWGAGGDYSFNGRVTDF